MIIKDIDSFQVPLDLDDLQVLLGYFSLWQLPDLLTDPVEIP